MTSIAATPTGAIMSPYTAPRLLSALLAILLLTACGCAKKKPKGPRALTPEQRVVREQKTEELKKELNEAYGKDHVRQEACKLFAAALDNPQFGNDTFLSLRQALKLAPEADAAEFLCANVTPEQTVQAIVDQIQNACRHDICRQYELIEGDEHVIRAAIVKRYPMLQERERLKVPNVKGQIVSGQIVKITGSMVQIGSSRIARVDLPPDVRARLWPDEYDRFIQKRIRDEQSRSRYHYDKYLPERMAKALPPALLAAGYLPDVSTGDTSLKDAKPEHWVTRAELLRRLAKVYIAGEAFETLRKNYAEDFWKRHGYSLQRLPNGLEWVPDEQPETDD